jgi:hypothetical protein
MRPFAGGGVRIRIVKWLLGIRWKRQDRAHRFPPRLTLAQARCLGEGLVKWYTRVVHNGFPRSPKIPYLLGFLHPVGRWKRVPPSPPLFGLSGPDA